MDNITATCSKCHKQFYIIKKEQEFLKEKGLPSPAMCPACRQERRLSLRGQRRQFFKSKCQKCGKEIIVTYDPAKVTNPIFCRADYDKYYAETDTIIKDPLPDIS